MNPIKQTTLEFQTPEDETFIRDCGRMFIYVATPSSLQIAPRSTTNSNIETLKYYKKLKGTKEIINNIFKTVKINIRMTLDSDEAKFQNIQLEDITNKNELSNIQLTIKSRKSKKSSKIIHYPILTKLKPIQSENFNQKMRLSNVTLQNPEIIDLSVRDENEVTQGKQHYRISNIELNIPLDTRSPEIARLLLRTIAGHNPSIDGELQKTYTISAKFLKEIKFYWDQLYTVLEKNIPYQLHSYCLIDSLAIPEAEIKLIENLTELTIDLRSQFIEHSSFIEIKTKILATLRQLKACSTQIKTTREVVEEKIKEIEEIFSDPQKRLPGDRKELRIKLEVIRSTLWAAVREQEVIRKIQTYVASPAKPLNLGILPDTIDRWIFSIESIYTEIIPTGNQEAQEAIEKENQKARFYTTDALLSMLGDKPEEIDYGKLNEIDYGKPPNYMNSNKWTDPNPSILSKSTQLVLEEKKN